MRQLSWVRSDSFHKGWIGALKHGAIDPEDAAWGFHQLGPKPVDSDDEDVVASNQLSSGREEDEVVVVNQESYSVRTTRTVRRTVFRQSSFLVLLFLFPLF